MCRHLAWLGRPRSLAALVLEPPSSRLVPGRVEPARWRSARPLWAEPSFASIAPVIESGCVLLAALVFARSPEHLGATVLDVAALDPAARLNLLASDGHRLIACTWGDTLSVLTTPEGTALAIEPWDDDPAWADVPDRHLVEVSPDGVSLRPVEENS
jgi:glutamine amidotransferase